MQDIRSMLDDFRLEGADYTPKSQVLSFHPTPTSLPVQNRVSQAEVEWFKDLLERAASFASQSQMSVDYA